MEVNVSLSAAGDGVEAVVLLPPGVSQAADVSVVVVGDDALLVEVAGGSSVQVALPIRVDADTGRVRFRRSAGRLTFTASAKQAPTHNTVAASAACGPTAGASCEATGGLPDPGNGPCTRIGRSEALLPAECVRALADAVVRGPVIEGPSAEQAQHPRALDQPSTLVPADSAEATSAAAAAAAAGSGTAASPQSGDAHSHHDSGPPAAEDKPTPAACSAPEQPASRTPKHGNEEPPVTGPATAVTEAAAAAVAAATAATAAATATGTPPTLAPPPTLPSPPTPTLSLLRSPGAASAGSADDAALYAEFFCNSPPTVPLGTGGCAAPLPPHSPPPPPSHPPPPSAGQPPAETAAPGHTQSGPRTIGHAAPPSPPAPAAAAQHQAGNRGAANGGGGRAAANANAAKVAAAFAPTEGTSGRAAGFSFTAPDLPQPPPLPPGLPPEAPPIDCRYLAVANRLRVSAHAPTAAVAELLGLRRAPSAAAQRRQAERVDEVVGRVAATLDAYGYAVLDNFIPEAAVQSARGELAVMEPHYSPGLIWVGREAESGAQIGVSEVRGDVVLWLDDGALGATAFVKDGVRRACSFMQLQQLLADVDELVFEGLRPRLSYLAGLHRRSDAMLAIYPGKGARFAKHVDNTTGDGRRLTVLTYLNPGWQQQQGGALRLFPVRKGAAPVVDVLPLAGRVALFLSAEVAHEVMPAFAPRHAVTLWYFDAGEHAAALTAARVMPGASSQPSAQAAATALLRDLLADEATSGVHATPEGCAALGTRVAALEAGAQQLLAAVLGLPGPAALVEAMRGLTPESLRMQREELRNMGLGTQHHAPHTSRHA